MPTVLRIGAYRFSFFWLDCSEPRHVHVVRERMKLKVCLDPVRAGLNEVFKQIEAGKIVRLLECVKSVEIVEPMSELQPQPDPQKTLLRAFAVLGMLVIAITGLCYSIWMLWAPRW